MGARVVPVSAPAANMSATGAGGDAMDISSPANTSAATQEHETNGKPPARSNNSSPPEQHASASSSMPAPPPAAAAAVHQPKIVQTAFIHKLYK